MLFVGWAMLALAVAVIAIPVLLIDSIATSHSRSSSKRLAERALAETLRRQSEELQNKKSEALVQLTQLRGNAVDQAAKTNQIITGLQANWEQSVRSIKDAHNEDSLKQAFTKGHIVAGHLKNSGRIIEACRQQDELKLELDKVKSQIDENDRKVERTRGGVVRHTARRDELAGVYSQLEQKLASIQSRIPSDQLWR